MPNSTLLIHSGMMAPCLQGKSPPPGKKKEVRWTMKRKRRKETRHEISLKAMDGSESSRKRDGIEQTPRSTNPIRSSAMYGRSLPDYPHPPSVSSMHSPASSQSHTEKAKQKHHCPPRGTRKNAQSAGALTLSFIPSLTHRLTVLQALEKLQPNSPLPEKRLDSA
mmetsp:Transcript_10461/g.20303  ORF Transcript_10461/g.20303 Transcript_10461/m.20303 type:complete len:165 (+) Transcript_10461:498-992(+)